MSKDLENKISRRLFLRKGCEFALGAVLAGCTPLDTEEAAEIVARQSLAAVPKKEVQPIASPYWTVSSIKVNNETHGVVQPADKIVDDRFITQYQVATENNPDLAWLLAHITTMQGKLFYNLNVGDAFTLIDSSNKTTIFEVSTVVAFQALDSCYYPVDPTTQERLVMPVGSLGYFTGGEVYGQLVSYDNPGDGIKTSILQTCIEKQGNVNWGRRMAIASEIVE